MGRGENIPPRPVEWIPSAIVVGMFYSLLFWLMRVSKGTIY